MQKILLALLVLLPSTIKILIYRKVLGWKVGKNVRIGFSYIDALKVEIGDRVQIGNFNVFQRIIDLSIGEHSYIRNFNQFSGGGYDESWTRILSIGEKVIVMNNHFVDVAGTVKIGSHTTIAGRDTHIWSHTMSYEGGIPKLIPQDVEIGEEVYIGARVTVLFCKIPNKAVIGAGSVVTKSLVSEGGRVLIAGNPAIIKKYY
jgi:acetyltransferase-like isoleucine patch superfamily enzyme